MGSPTAQVREQLKAIPLFASCSKKELSLLAGIVEEVAFSAGDALCEEGEKGLGLYVVLEGETQVRIGGKKRRDMGPGAFFGEIALLDGGPRSATIMAKTDVTALHIPAWSFNATLKSEPSLALPMLKEVCRRIRASDSEKVPVTPPG